MLVVSEIFPPRHGGSGRLLYELYRRLPPANVVAAAGLHEQAEDFDRFSGIRTERIPLHLDRWGVLGLGSFAQYWRLAARLRDLSRMYQCRELHVARCLPEGFAAWLLRITYGVPYVVYVHGEETRTSASSRELSWMTRRVYGGARYLIANSRNTAYVLQQEWGISRSRIRILYPGVDGGRFVPTGPSAQVRAELGWGGRRVVLTVGRLQLRKGHDMLLRALPRVLQTVPDAHYAVVGDGAERNRLQQLARELGVHDNVSFHGEISDTQMIACYQQCDVFALPNREVNGDFEGFGMVLLEAQACGRPVITGASGGTQETIDIGRTGLIGDCSTPDFLVDALSALLLDEPRRAAMGQAGRQWVLQQFDWRSLVKQAAEMFDIEMQEGR